jgi:hypothetical protein
VKTARDFVDLPRPELARILREGHPVDPGAIADFVYRGTSLGIPAWVERLAWKVFAKVFESDPETGHVRGWNLRIRQQGLDGPLEPLRKNGREITFGHFRVVSCEGYDMPVKTRGVLLDYGLGGNGALDPTSRVRDPIVALTPGSADVLLGWTYLDLGFARIGTPSYFLLERYAPLQAARP